MARGRWRPGVTGAGGVGGFRGVAEHRAEETEGRHTVLDVRGCRAPSGPCPRGARSALPDHPSPGSGLGCPLLSLAASRATRRPSRASLSPGEAARLLGPAGELCLARGLWPRVGSGEQRRPGLQEGERGHLSARQSPLAGRFTWTWTVREAEAEAGLGSEVHVRGRE